MSKKLRNVLQILSSLIMYKTSKLIYIKPKYIFEIYVCGGEVDTLILIVRHT